MSRHPKDEPTAMASEEAISMIGVYPVVSEIGSGLSGRVYECVDVVSPPPDRGRRVAIKILDPLIASDPQRLAQLAADFERIKNIPSPYVTRCFEFIDHQGERFIVEELLPGEDLQIRLDKQGPLPLKEALRYTRDVAKGLRAAWASGVAHGDLRPANLFVHERRVKIIDFCLALPVAPSASTLVKAPWKGTAGYMAPELVWGARPDPRADLYSLGCTLFALITGRPPFTHPTTAGLLIAHASEPAPSLQEFIQQPTPSLLSLIQTLLAKTPADRPTSHDECISLIETALNDVVGVRTSSSVTMPSMATLQSQSQRTTIPPIANTLPPSRPFPTPINMQNRVTPMTPSSMRASEMVEAQTQLVVRPNELTRSLDQSQASASGVGDPFASSDVSSMVVGAPTGVLGSLKQMNVTEIVQSLELGRKTAIVEIQPNRGHRGTLGVVQGAVVYAKTNVLGEEAFYELINHSDGYFRIHYGNPPPETNIHKATQFLLLEGLRRVDEQGVEAPVANAPIVDQKEIQEFLSAPSLPNLKRPPTKAPTSPNIETEITEPNGHVVSKKVKVIDKKTGLAAFPHFIFSMWESFWNAVFLALRPRVSYAMSLNLDSIHKKISSQLAFGLFVVACIALVLVLSRFRTFTEGPFLAILARGDRAEIATALDDLEEIPQSQRNGAWYLMKGHAFVALNRSTTDDAIDAYHQAVLFKHTDDKAFAALLTRLKDDRAEKVLAVFADWPKPEIYEKLKAHVLDADWNIRHQVVAFLKKNKEMIDDESLGILDLSTGASCEQRREGLFTLKMFGRSQKSIDAIVAAQKRLSSENNCMSNDIVQSKKFIEERMNSLGTK